jgi:HK97 gp10 family phage protein
MSVKVVIQTIALESMLRSASGPVGRHVFKMGVNIQSSAKRLCPVDTGRLRSSIQTTTPRDTGSGVSVRVGSNVNYARYVELGTRRMRARPFLRPALAQEVR